MNDKRTTSFPTVDVLSTITGMLVGSIGGVYEVLNWMTGESVFTHQLPRISREAQPVIVAMHPTLQQAVDEAEQVTPENWTAWRDLWLERYGPTIEVPKMNHHEHERVDPLSEAAEHFRPDQIIGVQS